MGRKQREQDKEQGCGEKADGSHDCPPDLHGAFDFLFSVNGTGSSSRSDRAIGRRM
jgi:hypothetical protein